MTRYPTFALAARRVELLKRSPGLGGPWPGITGPAPDGTYALTFDPGDRDASR
jgi:hypothetical protein